MVLPGFLKHKTVIGIPFFFPFSFFNKITHMLPTADTDRQSETVPQTQARNKMWAKQ